MAGLENPSGKMSNVKAPTDDDKALAKKMKPLVEEYLQRKFESFEPVLALQQVVTGTHIIKVKVSPAEFIHLRIYRDIGQNAYLHGVLDNKRENDELAYFDKNVDVKSKSDKECLMPAANPPFQTDKLKPPPSK